MKGGHKDMRKSKKNIVELLIELDKINRKLERIKNDPDYIKQEVNRVFGDKVYSDHERLNEILNTYL